MALGKASIEKRVAKVAEPAAEEIKAAPVVAAPVETAKPAAKKPAAKSTANKPATTAGGAKKAPAKKPAAPKAEPTTGVIANVSPEVVEKVVGHEENAAVEHVQIGKKMPNYLL